MPIIDIAHQHLITARALHASRKLGGGAEFDDLDWSAIIAASRVAAGLEGFNSGKVGFVFLVSCQLVLILPGLTA